MPTPAPADMGFPPDACQLDLVTRSDYDLTMKTVRIAELKARLSEHLRSVRKGRTLTVMDRDTPIARIIPYNAGSPLVIRSPVVDAPRLAALRMPPPLQLKTDIVALLAEERGDR